LAAQPMLAIVDFELPDGKGTELVRRLGSDGVPLPVVMITAYGSIDGAVEAIKAGCLDYVSKDRQLDAIALRVRNAMELIELRERVSRYEEGFARRSDESGLDGFSPAVDHLRAQVRAAGSAQDTTVLICGESGTGKQLVARAIHNASSRRDRPFVEVDCTTLAANLLESELFGHEKGSFTGAGERKTGLCEVADGGTLFLDEIGELDPGAQSKLLRLIQERSFRRVGGVREHKVDVRVLAATNRSLKEEMARGRFRPDLYYRVCVFSLDVPPLRDRDDDVIFLASRFVRELARKLGKPDVRLGDDALAALRGYAFPGNVRELRATIEQALVRCQGPVIDASLFPFGESTEPRRGRPRDRLSPADEQRIRAAMESSFGNQSKAASALGMSRFSLKRKLKLMTDEAGRTDRRR
jgi:two-component system response regulator AtoC